jgi:hypothetical protein
MEASALRCRGAGCAASKAPADAAADGPLAPRTHVATAAATALSVQDLSIDETASTVLQELRPLDAELVAALQQADIRLLRASWLRARPEGYVLQNRQELEALEEGADGSSANADDSPLLSPDEAVELIRCGDRRVSVVSHGWLKGGHCDPCGARVAVVVKALVQYPHLEACFWDYSSMFQKPRDEAQQASFERAIKVMGDLYASAVGTTVLQHKEIPQRPAEYDGVLRLGGMRCDEAAVRKALGVFGEIVRCEVHAGGDGALVYFATHGADGRAPVAHVPHGPPTRAPRPLLQPGGPPPQPPSHDLSS